ncbi:MAG: glycosyltransferase family 2 protein [Chloracidobacterium sp.]|nr:glycosyltransferase family 2 protein [Chloracidobacterium sp.]
MLTKPLLTLDLIHQAVFIFTIAMMAFIYVGYPALMLALSFFFRRPVRNDEITPSVSIIIAAYNEERDIAAKLENTLALDYPRDRMEIIVASDCSTDRTDEIVREYSNQGVILSRQPIRFGKTGAQRRAVNVSSGAILVFSDATTMYEPDAVRKIVRSFADPEVGCVAGQLIYADRAASTVGKGCRSYWGYEKFLKRCESQVGSLVGVSGCLYAVRRICHARLANDMIDDFVIPIEIHLQGLRTVYEPEAIAIEDTNHRSKDEFRMRVRVIKQTMSALRRYSEALNPRRHKMFALQLIVHKLLRYAAPFLLISALVSSLIASGSVEWLRLALLGQLALYGIAVIGWIGERLKIRLGPLVIPYYFALVNVASLVAFFKALFGKSYIVWEPNRDTVRHNPGAEIARRFDS